MQKILSLSAAAFAAVMLTTAAEAASPRAAAPIDSAPTSIRTADVTMVVSHGYAHVRKDPNTKSQILATLKKGAKVDVIEKVPGGKWAHVKTGKFDGYIALSLLKAA
ncbi:SH3 domain-containing protein [Dongia sedimenti]|uniref:SH3 domain-containing protein n=1 Tax=Dongia sedimenti TaxID=3064282 RepID=A0ABU0YJ19_9PROT|nr:SH3 domain-containing protein [Rhodospirillaceae bacterium R-7]